MRLRHKDLLGLSPLTAEEIDLILHTAVPFKKLFTRSIKKVPTLRGKTVALLFYEPSTRTRTSFELAAARLSADVLGLAVASSSVQKGESLMDTALNLEAMKVEANAYLSYFVNFCNSKGWAAKSYLSFGTDSIEEFTRLAERVRAEFPNAIFFTSKLVFDEDNWFTGLLHNQAAIALQRRFHLRGMQMVILPMKLST